MYGTVRSQAPRRPANPLRMPSAQRPAAVRRYPTAQDRPGGTRRTAFRHPLMTGGAPTARWIIHVCVLDPRGCESSPPDRPMRPRFGPVRPARCRMSPRSGREVDRRPEPAGRSRHRPSWRPPLRMRYLNHGRVDRRRHRPLEHHRHVPGLRWSPALKLVDQPDHRASSIFPPAVRPSCRSRSWRRRSTAASSIVQHGCELLERKRPPVVEALEFLWGKQGMLDGHQCLVVTDGCEGDVDDTVRCRVRPVGVAPREAQQVRAVDGRGTAR